jgi:hypothetical protein
MIPLIHSQTTMASRPFFSFKTYQPDPVKRDLEESGLEELVKVPNYAYPWTSLYNRESDEYIYRDGGPLQADRFAPEASSVERAVFNYGNVLRTRQLAARELGLSGSQLPDEETTLTILQQVFSEEVPFGDMMTPSLLRGVYPSGFMDRVVRKITETAAHRIAVNVSINMQSQTLYHVDRATHGIRGVFEIDPPQYSGRVRQDLTWNDRMPQQPWRS